LLQRDRGRGQVAGASGGPRTAGLRHVLISDVRDLEPHRAAWDALAEETSHPLVQPTWLLAWWRHCAAAAARPAVVLVFDGEHLVGVAPFYLRRDGLGLVRAELMAAEASIGTGPLARPGCAAEVAAEIVGALAAVSPRPDILVLAGVPAAEGWSGLLADAWPSSTITVTRKTVPAPFAELSTETYEQWLAGRSKNFRSQVRRRRRRLEDRGVRFSRVTPDRAGAAMQAFTRLHLERWSSRGGSRAMSDPVNCMLDEALPPMLRSGGCRLYVGEVGTTVVAASLFLTAGRSSSYWLGGFAQEYAADSPMIVQITDVVADCFASGHELLDFGAGEQPYKLRFAAGSSTLEWTSIVTATGARRPYARLHTRGVEAATAAVRRLSPETRERLLSLRHSLAHRPAAPEAGRSP
jgi:CelD/BcsL family acetyltransferase involved in cellulose biosynthesis